MVGTFFGASRCMLVAVAATAAVAVVLVNTLEYNKKCKKKTMQHVLNACNIVDIFAFFGAIVGANVFVCMYVCV